MITTPTHLSAPLPASARVEPVDPPSIAVPSDAPAVDLDDVRRRIDRVDGRIVRLIARRVGLAVRAGDCKRAAGAEPIDPAREAAVVRNAARLARRAGLDEEVVRGMFWHLVRLSRQAQHAGAEGAR